jgi:nitronate monooxygenase
MMSLQKSRTHKQRLIEADETVLTELFGLGWPAPHRVLRNAATERWLRSDTRGPASNRALNRLSAFGARYIPAAIQERMIRAQHPGSRLLTPITATDDRNDNLLDAGALYAGQTVTHIHDIRPASELVAALTP